MAEDSKIEWTHHTFNPWRGCTKVSQGCKNCYAETLSGRNPATLGVWGPGGSRPVASEAYWRHPLRWDREAQAAGDRRRVFCASLADVFEGDDAMPEDARAGVAAARRRLFELIDATPNLDWLLLTKRPENIQALWPFGWYDDRFTWPNLWLGTSVEDQAAADRRIPELLGVPAAVRFLSCEPLLAPVNVSRFMWPVHWSWDARFRSPQEALAAGAYAEQKRQALVSAHARFVSWVIVGGESGPGARPMHPDWARSLRDQCQVAGVPFFMKQWGEWLPVGQEAAADFSLREPEKFTLWQDEAVSLRVGKKAAGRLLDGRVWDQSPDAGRRSA